MVKDFFLSKIRKGQGCLLSPLPFNTVLKGLASTVREDEEIKDMWIGMEEVKVLLMTYNYI